jgi:hypothetical protein
MTTNQKQAKKWSFKRGKTRKTNKWQEKRQTKEKTKKSLTSNSKLPLKQTP